MARLTTASAPQEGRIGKIYMCLIDSEHDYPVIPIAVSENDGSVLEGVEETAPREVRPVPHAKA